jgi:hypothetical protein
MKNGIGVQNGQTLIALMIFVLMGIIVTTFATLIIAQNSLSIARLQQGTVARQLADSGVENALINILRNDAYSGGEMAVDGDTVIATVSGTTTKTIRVAATSGSFKKEVEVVATFINNKLTVTSWKEIY